MSSTILNRAIAPELQAIDRFHLPQVKTVSLLNGVHLHTLAMGQQPVVRLEWGLPAGSVAENKQGAAFFAAKMLTEGTNRYSSVEIQDYFAELGAFIEVTPGTERLLFTLYALDKHIPALVSFVHHLLSESTLPESEFEKLRRIQIQTVEVNLKKTSYIASTHFRSILFGKEHLYGRHLDVNAIQALSIDDIKEVYSTAIQNNVTDIFITGGYSEKSIESIQAFFGTTPTLPSSVRTIPSPVLTSTSLTTVPVEGSVQSSIRIGRPTFAAAHPDYFDASIYTEILGGYFGSRLMQNIREDKGYTYGIHASMVNLQHLGYFVIGTDVKRAHTAATIEEVKKEMKLLRSEPVPSDELQNVQQYLLGSFINSIQTPFAIADKFKSIYFQGLEYQHYQDFFHRIQVITSEDILKIAQTHFQEDDMTMVIAGGMEE
ncbi:MAG: insulinase family protein [Cytophagaceae bacterium]|jgi:predicted Zn-dependent peptidase|nr:insulinase family protein [Cytophagaceae bacterium]